MFALCGWGKGGGGGGDGNQRLVVLFPRHFLAAKLGFRGRKFGERELGLHVKKKKLVIFVCSRFLMSY